MWMLALVVLASVELGGPFGTAAASAEPSTATTMELELTVQGPASASVVAHLVEPGGEQQTVAMAERSPGAFGAVIEVGRLDYVVVFEVVDRAAQSTPVRLTDLGVDPTVVGSGPGIPPTTEDPGLSNETRQWGWLALALAASALSLLAVWALGERRGEESDETVAQDPVTSD
jgi:hypothetical protein